MKKVSLLILIISQLVFGATSPLLNPSKKSNSGIIDVGYNNGSAPVAASIPKEMIGIPALMREIDQNIFVKERTHEELDCRFDEYGKKACPEDSMACNANAIMDIGYSKTTTKTVFIYAEKIPASTQVVYNNWYYERQRGPGSKFLEEAGLSWSRCQNGIYTDHYGNNFNNPSYGRSMPKWDSWYNGNYGGTSQRSGWSSNVESNKLNGYGGVPVESYGSCCGFLRRICSVTQTVPAHCPEGYQDNGANCKKSITYTYNDYFCPVNPVDNLPWTLINAGGDCNGIGLNANNECNSVIPPANNCIRIEHKCPIGDEQNECAKKATTNSLAENLFEGMSYRPGSVDHFQGKVEQTKICPEQSSICGGISNELTFMYDTTTNKCISGLIKEDRLVNEFDLCKTGYKFSEEKGFCYRELAGTTINFNTLKYEALPIDNYNEDRNLCVSPLKYSCDTGFVYDIDSDECIGDYVCKGNWNATTGKCEVEPQVDCGVGYQYSYSTQRCEADPYCITGILNENPNIFKCESNKFKCPADWNLDSSANECRKPIVTMNPVCPESFQTWNKYLHICEGYANFNAWSEEDPWGTGTWSLQNGGASIYQSTNGTLPTFFLSTGKYTSSVMKGSVHVNSASGDNDSIGIAFGYKASNNYFLINWEMNSGGNSGGSYLLSLQQINGGTPARHGGTGGVTLAGANIGWSYNTWYTIEVRAVTNRVQVYINGSLKIDANNVNLPTTPERIGFFNQSQNMVTYKDFYIASTPICTNSNYVYNADKDLCLEKNVNGYEVDLGNLEYVLSVGCSDGGTYNSATRKCESTPKCHNLGTLDNVAKTCYKDESFSCSLGYSLETNNGQIQSFDKICATTNVCPAGTNRILINGEYKCKSNKVLECPAGYQPDNKDSNKCVAPAHCAEGYIEEGTQCVLNYNYSLYGCPTGWGEPLDKGANCEGSCGFNGCWCNGENSPANNCQKPLVISSGAESFELTEKRRLQYFFIDNNVLSEYDFGEFKDILCGDKCLFNVNHIYGENNQLCFVKGNSERNCFKVNNCYFSGEIKASSSDPEIDNLYLYDSHTLMSTSKKAKEVMLDGDIRLTFAANKGFDYSEATPTPDYSSWNNNGKKEGFSLKQSAIKLSDGNWYVKELATNPTSCGFSSQLKTLPATAYKVHSWSNTCYTGTTNNSNSCALDLTISLPIGLSFVGYSDIESVIAKEFNTAACNSDNAYDEEFTLDNYSLTKPVKITRKGVGITGSTSINIVKETCEFTYDPATNTCVESDFNNAIVSTCKMNGHVGWAGREEGITSISTGTAVTRFALLESTGTVSYNKDWQASGDTEGKTEWNGFNIGTMALQLSDGNWYVSDTYRDKNGVAVARNLPKFIKKMPVSNYQSTPEGLVGVNCFHGGKDMYGSCSTSLKVIMPNPKFEVIGISDIESLVDKPENSADNQFTLTISIGNLKNIDYSGTGVITPKEFSNSDVTVEIGGSSVEKIIDRLQFWDSHKDKEIGFIEFARDVKDSDRLDNFVPENQIPYVMAAKGFTSIDYSELIKQTYFVKPTPTSEALCQEIATEIGGSVYSVWPLEHTAYASSIGAYRDGSCTILKNAKDSFGLLSWAVRKNIYNGSYAFECSPYICGTSGSCDIAKCPVEEVNNHTYEYFGNILPASYKEEGCREQTCDGNKAFVDYCGREVGCDSSANNVFVENGNCFEMYCNEGILNTETKSCMVERCPVGTIPSTDGKCK